MKEALFYHKGNDKEVNCFLCHHRCTIKVGSKGICGVRENREPKLVASEASGVVDRVLIQGIVKVTSIYDLEDFGPGYHVTTLNGESAVIIGQVLADVDYEGEGLPASLTLKVDSGSKEILDVHGDGDEIPVTLNCSLQSIGIDGIMGFSLCDRLDS